MLVRQVVRSDAIASRTRRLHLLLWVVQAALWSLPPALLVSSCFMGWRVAAASAAAFLTAQLVNVNVSERLPRGALSILMGACVLGPSWYLACLG